MLLLHQIAIVILENLLHLVGGLILLLQNPAWQGIAGFATIVSMLLTLRNIASDKLKQAEIDELKLLLRKGVMYHKETATKQTQKAPLIRLLAGIS